MGSFHGVVSFRSSYHSSSVLSLVSHKRTTVYMTIANSWAGFLKDLAFISIVRLGGHRIVLHCHGGNYGPFYSEAGSLTKWLIRISLGSADQLIILSEIFRSDFYFLHKARTKNRHCRKRDRSSALG